MRTLQEELSKKKLTNKKPKKRNRKKKESYTFREIEDLMGTNRTTFKRKKGGSIVQK